MTTTTTTPETVCGAVMPEKRLMAAVLNDALDVVAHPETNPKGLVRQTYAWFASDDGDFTFSFRNVCAVLGIDPLSVRAVVARHDRPRRLHRLAA
jgi:hypothetical protein